MKYMKKLFNLLIIFNILFLISACDDEDVPPEENPEELITFVELTFTPEAGGTPVVARAEDPDGEGVQDIAPLGPISLNANQTYVMTIELGNDDEDITEEINKEKEEHMFFFEFTDGLFTDPNGNGNADNRSDQVNYEDFDADQYPVGLITEWTTGDAATGTFRVVLKHQPDGEKTAASTVNDGETDVSITWNISIQ
jgi:hypothetical protein